MNDRLLPLFSIRVIEMTTLVKGSPIGSDFGTALALARAARQWVRRE